ncbi:MAG: NmrA/HSCARG family protein [Deltaproteobacteria bacterium]|nr:NmrA/HSCARG family protein [Deltaproteobacteria bacterium]
MASRKTILVTGATGQQGGAVARCLISKGQNVRVLTRSPEKARELAQRGAEVLRGDFDDRESLKEAVRGADGVFIVGTPFEKGPEAEMQQGKEIVLACWKFGAPQIVYTSVCAANKNTGIPHFESKAKVESYIKETGQACTILRPVWFMENFASPWLAPSIEKGVMTTPVHPERKLQMIALSDIGEFASEAFLRPDEFLGKDIDLAGDELTMRDIVMQISCASNREVRYEQIPDEKAEAAVGHDFALMYLWFNRVGYQVDIPQLEHRWGIRMTTFSRWLGRSALYRKAA